MQWDYFFCPFVSSWLNTDAASFFESATVAFFDPDRIFPASVETFEDDCFLGDELFLAMMILLQVIRLPQRGETLTCRQGQGRVCETMAFHPVQNVALVYHFDGNRQAPEPHSDDPRAMDMVPRA